MSTRRPRKPSKRKAPTKRRKTPPRKGRHKPVTSAARSKRTGRGILWRLLWVCAAGAVSGLMLAGWVLWRDASRSVNAYLATPPTQAPSTILSDMFTVQRGATVSQSRLIADLLAAGFERTPGDQEPQDWDTRAMSVKGDTVAIWTPLEEDGQPWTVGRMELQWSGGKIARTRPSDGVTLPPVPLATLGDLERQRVKVELTELGPWLEPALVAMEDTRFREHVGIDPLGIARAVVVNVFSDGQRQGGSTITQQLAKNLFAGSARNVKRKVREAFFAAALEANLSKDELLSLYFSEVYLGQMGGLPLYGVHQASIAWFGTSPDQLSLPQAASIVGTIPAPNAFSPSRHPERAKVRRDLVLTRLEELGAIGRDTANNARQTPLALSGIAPSRIRGAPYAVDYLIDEAEKSMGQGGLTMEPHTVQSSIDPTLQHAAEVAVQTGLSAMEEQYPATKGAQAALIALRASDGAIVAMVGGRSYTATSFNRSAHAHRHAGSTVKPFLALTALERGLVTPATLLEDEPLTRTVDGKDWTPQNADGTFEGAVTVRRAMERSRNIPMVHLSERLGLRALQTSLNAVGLSKATALPSSALGAFDTTPLQLASAYTVFPAGARATPYLIQSVDGQSHAGKPGGRLPTLTVANADAVALTTDMLRGVVTRGTGRGLQDAAMTRDLVGKTGTTNGFRDAWFAGATAELSIVVWVGMDKGTLGLSGSRAALPIWREFVDALPPSAERLPHSSRLLEVDICEEDGLLTCPTCASPYTEWFVPGTEPTRSCKPADGLMGTLENWFKKPPEAETTSDTPSSRKTRRQQRGGSKSKPKVRPPP